MHGLKAMPTAAARGWVVLGAGAPSACTSISMLLSLAGPRALKRLLFDGAIIESTASDLSTTTLWAPGARAGAKLLLLLYMRVGGCGRLSGPADRESWLSAGTLRMRQSSHGPCKATSEGKWLPIGASTLTELRKPSAHATGQVWRAGACGRAARAGRA